MGCRIGELREELSRCCGQGSVIARKGSSLEWWTFAGLAANQTIAQYLRPRIGPPLRADNLWTSLPPDASVPRLHEIIQELRGTDAPPDWDLQQPATDLLKFSELLPEHLLRELIMARIADVPYAREILSSPVRFID